MGQVQNHQNSRHDGRAGALRKTLLSNVVALGLTLTLGCSAQGQESWTSSSYQFSADNAWAHLIKQVNFGPRVPGTDAQIKCRDFLQNELKNTCDDVQLQHLTHKWSRDGKDLEFWNVIGTQNWKDAKVHVVLLAHWDSRPFADGPNSPVTDRDKPIPGADDGASGVAVLLELARAIKGRHPDVGVLFLLDDGEDLGPGLDEMLLGVDYFANHLPDPKPDYGILLDMIGNKGLAVTMEQHSLSEAEKVTRAFFSNAMKIDLGKTFIYSVGDEIEDDHLPLLKKGIPTLDLIDFNYPQWHTTDDTAEHCSPDSLRRVGVALESFLLKSPIFIPGK